jgi:hypothetical protein
MINLRASANRMTSAINPNMVVQWQAFAGYATGPDGKTAAAYTAPVALIAQVQALSKAEIEHIDALNLSPCERAIYCNGQLQAFDRAAQTGGDLLFFEGRQWLVMAILEGWTATAGGGGWCKAALTGQMGGPP